MRRSTSRRQRASGFERDAAASLHDATCARPARYPCDGDVERRNPYSRQCAVSRPARTRLRRRVSRRQARGPIIDQDGREIPAEIARASSSSGFRFDFGHSSANPFGDLTREQRLARLEALAKLLDVAFILPGTKIRYGIDGIIRLIPVVGDLVRDRVLAVAGARGARARRALACHRADARQCRGRWRGRNGAGRGRRLRRAVPRQHAQRAAAAALDGQAAALAHDPESAMPRLMRQTFAQKAIALESNQSRRLSARFTSVR